MLKNPPCQVILSGDPSGPHDHDQELSGWGNLQLLVRNQAGVSSENVWFNVTPDRVCIGHAMPGRITPTRAESRARRYAKPPPGERRAVLSGLMGTEAGKAAHRAMPEVGGDGLMDGRAIHRRRHLREEHEPLSKWLDPPGSTPKPSEQISKGFD